MGDRLFRFVLFKPARDACRETLKYECLGVVTLWNAIFVKTVKEYDI